MTKQNPPTCPHCGQDLTKDGWCWRCYGVPPWERRKNSEVDLRKHARKGTNK